MDTACFLLQRSKITLRQLCKSTQTRFLDIESRRVAVMVGVVVWDKELVLAWEDEDLLRIGHSNSIVGLYSMPPR